MAHKIGGEFHLTHGEANAILLPYIIQYNKKATSKYAKLEGILGIDNLEEAIWNLNQRLGLTRTIQEGQNTAISEADFQAVIDRMSPRALEDACTLTNPRKPTTEDIKKIYEAAYYGKPVDF